MNLWRVRSGCETPDNYAIGQPTAPDDCVEATIDLDFLGDKTLQEGLAEAGFTADKPSLFVAEGLIMYLGPEGCLSLSAPNRWYGKVLSPLQHDGILMICSFRSDSIHAKSPQKQVS